MKTFLITILLTCSLVVTAYAADLRWDAAPTATGYNVYFNDDQSGTYPYHYNAGNVTEIIDIKTVFNLQPGRTYTFMARAYNGVGESPDSNTDDWTVPVDYNSPDPVLPITVTAPATITITIE